MERQHVSLDASLALSDLRNILQEHLSMGPDRRERIATAALQGLMSSSYREYEGAFGGSPVSVPYASDPKRAARAALVAADALIAELDKPAQPEARV